ncbi:hypothetical protein ABT147_18595 [Streptomyces sp. NPDC001868]|uniref:hypothetical protein n=1 Tax=Streptomyces sp. NPDC001868 TaxID=3154401 RepID=UPI003332FE58
MIMPADGMTWALGHHPRHGLVVGKVTGWRITRRGVKAVINYERVPHGWQPEKILRGTPTEIAEVAWLMERADLAGVKTKEQYISEAVITLLE